MTTIKVAITIDQTLLAQIDDLVAQQIFPNRSKAIQMALTETLHRRHRRRLAAESAKLIPHDEQALAEEGMEEESQTWPVF